MISILMLVVITVVYKVGIAAGLILLGLVGYYILLRIGSLAIFKSKSDVSLATERKMMNRILEKSKQRKGDNT